MAGPFRAVPARRGLGSALRSKRASTFEAIENLLARCQSVRDVSRSEIASLCQAQDVDLARRFASERKHLYRRYLAFCLEDKALTADENADLDHLRMLLELRDTDVATVHDEVAFEVYGKAIDEVLADLKIDADEEAFLRRLQGELAVSDRAAAELLARGEYRARDVALSRASAPDDEFSMNRISAGRFTGRSDETFEAAVADAISKAQLVIPRLHWFEVTQVAGYVGDGAPKSWHVIVSCGLPPGANT